MSCTGRYATADAYASFWCNDNLVAGNDDSGGIGNPSLYCSYVDFLENGIEANVGMILYNITQGTSGVVTAVTEHSLTATGVTWDDGDAFSTVSISAAERTSIENFLNQTAATVSASLGAAGACDCTLSTWGAALLSQLNIVAAGLFHKCPCGSPDLTDEQRTTLQTWLDSQLLAIRTTEIDVCDGETGSKYPAFGWIEQSVTEFAAVRIIQNDILRNQ